MATGNYIRFDWAMKRLLRDKANFDVLNGLLSTLLGETIIIKSILESEGNQEDESSKFNRVDLLAEDSRGKLIIVEVQNSHEIDYWQRVLFGTCEAIMDHINLGEPYSEVRKVYSVNIVYFHVRGNDYVYHGNTRFLGIHTNEELVLTPKQRQQFGCEKVGEIYPEYFILCVENFDKVATTHLDEWMSFLKTTTIPDNATAPGLDAVRKKLSYDSLSPDEKKKYKRQIDNMNFEKNVITSNYLEGELQGLVKGKAEGELTKAVAIAKSMKDEGISPDIISKCTGLSEDEIAQL